MNAVFQTQWTIITSDGHSWLEIGTGHGCNGLVYWFAGYGYQGVYTPLFTQRLSTLGRHQFQMRRGGDGQTWAYYVDVTPVATVTWATQGVRVEAGLESYDSDVQLGSIVTDTMIKFFPNALQGDLSSAATQSVDLQMCGRRISANSIATGEHTTTC